MMMMAMARMVRMVWPLVMERHHHHSPHPRLSAPGKECGDNGPHFVWIRVDYMITWVLGRCVCVCGSGKGRVGEGGD